MMKLEHPYPWRREFATAGRIKSRLKNKNEKPPTLWSNFFHDLLSNLSLHGLHHIAKEDKLMSERILWAVATLLASLGMAAACYNSYLNYRHPSVTTTLKTTRNDCANIPFPSVTICDTSRVDWQKANNLSMKDIPNSGNVTKEHLLVLLRALADMSFGDFDFMDTLSVANLTSKDFGDIDINKLLKKVQRSCSEVFKSSRQQCWWREKYHNCCHLFEVQISDLGFCYSFNGDLSESAKKLSWGYGLKRNYWLDGYGHVRPRRSGASGPWSGLRFTVDVMSPEQVPSGTNLTPGVMFYLEDPRSYPNSENQHVDPGTFVDVRVQGTTQQAEERVRSLDFEDRNCLFLGERTGWTGVYSERNCQVQCQQNYALKYCNCSPSFLFIDDDDDPKHPPCSVKGLNCLKRFNFVFNSKIPNTKQEVFFKGVNEGMQCDCPVECNSQQYMFDTVASQTQNLSQIGFDIHYRGQLNILYTSDVVGGPMDFIVAIGGIAGLFLGGSLLSGVELIYFFTFRFFYHWRKCRQVKPKIKFNKKIAFIK